MDLMDHLFPRADTTCTGDKLWYVCTAGDYKGCCSSNPCTSGVCPDDDSTSSTTTTTTKSSSTSSPSSTSTSSSSSSSTTSTTLVAQVSPSSTSIIGGTSSSSTSITSATSTSSSTSPSTSISNNHGAINGGVVGGILALLIAVLLLFLWRRRSRMKAAQCRTIDPGPFGQPSHPSGPGSPTLYMKRLNKVNGNRSLYPHLEPSFVDSNNDTMMSTLTCHPDKSTTSLSLVNGHAKPMTIVTPNIPSTELLASIPNRPGYTPELPDSTFQRMRAELPSDSSRDLINQPLDQRRGILLYQRTVSGPSSPLKDSLAASVSSSPRNTHESPKSSSGSGDSTSGSSPPSRMSPKLMARNTARRLVTEEGVVMGANLDRYSGDPREDGEVSIRDWNKNDHGNREEADKGKENSWHSQHFMSFMDFGNSITDSRGESGASSLVSPPVSPPVSHSVSSPVSPPLSVGNKVVDGAFMDSGPLSPTTSEVPPAYIAGEAEFEVNGERKTPAVTMGLGVRRLG
ncbi:hypothetical protein N7520_002724 [Penicillium odoratum]|uniref:uncharacterized protein n=1 Tax=Penicillium odoratum TaxID=1167516 RepID=UPI00254705E8|nr:uncharacterized protein N7520_002724 [Penicillium odoratum]KAJ5772195.1 hypothetical protein N7520_002724 [Penicillium odoratum]